jgi:hypothetical protein
MNRTAWTRSGRSYQLANVFVVYVPNDKQNRFDLAEVCSFVWKGGL